MSTNQLGLPQRQTTPRTATSLIQSQRTLGFINQTVVFVILGVAALAFLIPLLWMISTSLKPKEQIFAYPLVWIPNPPQWENYARALNNPSFKFLLFLQNSLYYAILSTIGVVFSCALVAYAFARLRWWGRDFWFLITLSTMMIPYPVTLIPQFLIFKELGWVGTFLPLIVPNFLGAPFFIFLLRQFFLTIPMDLSDAARIDGANDWAIFWRVILPLTQPALITVALFTFLSCWNDFLGPLIFLTDGSKYTLAVGLAAFRGQYRTQWDLMMAAATVVTGPIVILFFFAQRRFIQGITLTGMKG
jgi:multiple sugar transport system permease protein